MLSNVLSDDSSRASAFGAGGVLTLKDRAVAAKTGTTNSYIDSWTIGYTPSLVAGVWAGNTDNTPMKRGFGGSKVAAPIWNAFMEEALKYTSAETFPDMPSIDTNKAVLLGQDGGSVKIKVNKATGRRASTSTPEHLIVEKEFIQPHSILHYVLKDDPQGAVPTNPENDPQYNTWEESITNWITRKQEEDPEWTISFEEPPTEVDDKYSIELIPTLEVVFPTPNAVLTSRVIDTDIRASAPRGVKLVTYKIDDIVVEVARSHPFNLNYNARELDSGEHVLSITVEDDIGNRYMEDVPFTLEAGKVKPAVHVTNPIGFVSANEFPKTMLLSHTRLEEAQTIRLFVESKDGENTIQIGEIPGTVDLFDNQIIFNWPNNPGVGEWKLYIEVETKDGELIVSDVNNITIE